MGLIVLVGTKKSVNYGTVPKYWPLKAPASEIQIVYATVPFLLLFH